MAGKTYAVHKECDSNPGPEANKLLSSLIFRSISLVICVGTSTAKLKNKDFRVTAQLFKIGNLSLYSLTRP